MHVLTCRYIVVCIFPQEEAVLEKLWGQPQKALRFLTFPFSKAITNAYSAYKCHIESRFTFLCM
jgi:hypothetical protein